MSTEWTEGDYRISDDKSLLSVGRICKLLYCSYWASRMSRERVRLSLENSLCYGVYHKGTQVGFARAVTDMATVYWIADVSIDQEHRRKGLGKRLIKLIVESDELKGLQGILATSTAYRLYEECGFRIDHDQLMMKPVIDDVRSASCIVS
jgi:GNAT superfamily N-acetyltransferase